MDIDRVPRLGAMGWEAAPAWPGADRRKRKPDEDPKPQTEASAEENAEDPVDAEAASGAKEKGDEAGSAIDVMA